MTFIVLKYTAFPFTGDVARLISPVIRATDTTCSLRFHYHMYGINIRRLRIYTQLQDGGPLNQVWSKTENQGDFWERGDANLDVTINVPFRVCQINGNISKTRSMVQIKPRKFRWIIISHLILI